MKSSRKLKATVPNDYNHWTPKMASTPPIMMAIIGLLNTYYHIVRVILWQFLNKLIVPLSTIIT